MVVEFISVMDTKGFYLFSFCVVLSQTGSALTETSVVASLNHKELGKSQVPTLEVGDIIEADLWKSNLGKGAVRWRGLGPGDGSGWGGGYSFALDFRDLAIGRAVHYIRCCSLGHCSFPGCHLAQGANSGGCRCRVGTFMLQFGRCAETFTWRAMSRNVGM